MTEQDLSSVDISHKVEKLLCNGKMNQGRLKKRRKKDGEIREREREREFHRKLKLEGNPGSAGFFHHWNDLYYRHECMNSTSG